MIIIIERFYKSRWCTKSILESHYTSVKPVPVSNSDYSSNGKAAIDKIIDNGFEHDETTPLISKEQHCQPKTRQCMVASGHYYNSIEDTQPLLEGEW